MTWTDVELKGPYHIHVCDILRIYTICDIVNHKVKIKNPHRIQFCFCKKEKERRQRGRNAGRE